MNRGLSEPGNPDVDARSKIDSLNEEKIVAAYCLIEELSLSLTHRLALQTNFDAGIWIQRRLNDSFRVNLYSQ